MKIEIKVPAMGESISEATIGTILKPSGSTVVTDEELLELETDKVNQILYAPQAGKVTWEVKEEEVVKVGQTIGYIEPLQQEEGIPSKEVSEDAKGKEEKGQQQQPEEEKATLSQQPEEEKTRSPQVEKTSEKLYAEKPSLPRIPLPSPTLAKGARATKELFLAELSALTPAKLPRQAPVSSPQKPSEEIKETRPPYERKESRKKMPKIRKIIAARMVESLQQTAMLTTFNEVDMTKIMHLRETYKEDFLKQNQTRLGFMPFFVKAVVSGMQAFSNINAYIDGEEMVYREYYDISIAVGTDRGVVVPVVRGCDRLSFAEIERAIEGYARQAREGGLSPDDLQGGCFTITNGGTYGSLLSTPILNPPQSAILGMHKIEKRPVVVNDEITIRQMMYLALSYDHRIIDGKEAVSFLVHVKNCLEDPSRLLLGI